MNKIKKLKALITISKSLPVMFRTTTYLISDEIEDIVEERATIDLNWDLRRQVEIEDYKTSQFFVSSPYFRPVTKYAKHE